MNAFRQQRSRLRTAVSLLLLYACGAASEPGQPGVSPALAMIRNLPSDQKGYEAALHRRAHAITVALPLEKKLGQLVHLGIYGRVAGPGIEDVIRRYHPGGIILFAVNIGSSKDVTALTSGLQSMSLKHSGVPLLISVDQEGGRVQRVSDGVTDFPGMMTLGQTEDERLAYTMGFLTSRELRARGMNFLFAPDIDVNNNPANPVINTRSPGSDADLVAKTGTAYMLGAMDARGLPTLKHFPGHGDTDTDSHLALPVVDRSVEELEKVEFVPFRRSIEAGAPAVMVGHILLKKVDATYPSTLSAPVVKGLLRDRLNFQGLIITDAMEMKAVADRYPMGESALMAFRAGVDIILLTAQSDHIRQIEERFKGALEKGEIQLADVDRAVERQIYLKLKSTDWTGDDLVPQDGASIEDGKRIVSTHAELEQKADALAAQLRREYGGRPDAAIAERGVRSLRRDFAGLSSKESTFVFYRTRSVREEALRLGLAPEHVQPLFHIRQLLIRHDVATFAGPWIVELNDTDVADWNRLVQRTGDRSVVGVLAGSPFLPWQTTEHAAILGAFSPQASCREALVRRAFTAVPAAKLRLVESVESVEGPRKGAGATPPIAGAERAK